jgi:hypothetical protein
MNSGTTRAEGFMVADRAYEEALLFGRSLIGPNDRRRAAFTPLRRYVDLQIPERAVLC